MNIRKRRSDRSRRVRLFSPGRPPVAGREERRRFWAAIAAGTASEDAAVGVGVPQAVGTRWFRKAGGMPPSMFGLSAKPLCGRYVSFAEREEIALLRVRATPCRRSLAGSGEWHRQSPESCGATPPPEAAASRIVRRQRNGTPSALLPPKAGEACAQRGVKNLCRGTVGWRRCGSERAPVPGPVVSSKSRRHGPRKDRRWANAWSPEQIARRLPADLADDAIMRISHEAIYQALFVQGRGGVAPRTDGLPAHRARVADAEGAHARARQGLHLSRDHDQPTSGGGSRSRRAGPLGRRPYPGSWEFGDGTLVERTTRFTLLLYLPRMAGHGHEARVKNGPALAGHGAEAVRDAISHDRHVARATAPVADLGSRS